MNEIKFDEFFKDNFDTTGIEDNIYSQIAKDMARCIDIDLAKTPLVDILTGYTRYKIQELEIERLNKENEELKKIQCTFLGTGCKAEMERLNNIINEFDKWLLGEQMMFYKGSDNERLIRYGETKLKWLELKGDDKAKRR